jgi:hypothetical protein
MRVFIIGSGDSIWIFPLHSSYDAALSQNDTEHTA